MQRTPEVDELIKKAQQTVAQQFISDKELQQRFDSAKKFAMDTMEQSDGVQLMFIAHLRRRESDPAKPEWAEAPIVFTDWQQESKYEVMRGLGAKIANEFADYMLVCIVQVGEAWMANYAAEDAESNGPHLAKGVPMPSERDDKVEVLIVDALTIDQRHSSTMIPIIRKSSGEFGTWGPERQNLYEPNSDSDTTQQNFLLLNMFMGSTEAGVALRNKK